MFFEALQMPFWEFPHPTSNGTSALHIHRWWHWSGADYSRAFYRYLKNGVNAGDANIRAYLKDGPQAALRAITPTEDFYQMASRREPSVDPKTWSFKIDGLVKNPLRFAYEEIRALPVYETTLTLECISNPVGGRYIGNAVWKETLLKPLRRAGGNFA